MRWDERDATGGDKERRSPLWDNDDDDDDDDDDDKIVSMVSEREGEEKRTLALQNSRGAFAL